MQASLAGWALDDFLLAYAILLRPRTPFANDSTDNPHFRQRVFYLLVPFRSLFDSAAFPLLATGKLLFLGAFVAARTAHALEDAGRGVIAAFDVTLRVVFRCPSEMV